MSKALGRRKALWGAAVVWAVATVVIVVVNGLVRFGEVLVGPSISMYVGYEAWSVGVFLAVNGLLVAAMARYLAPLKKEMGRVWWGLGVVVMGGLMAVSVFPWGFFDEGGAISVMHRVAAYTMFGAAVPFVALTMGKFRERRGLRVLAWGFLGYALACLVLMAVWSGWWDMKLPLEAIYVAMMMGVILGVPGVVEYGGIEPPTS